MIHVRPNVRWGGSIYGERFVVVGHPRSEHMSVKLVEVVELQKLANLFVVPKHVFR